MLAHMGHRGKGPGTWQASDVPELSSILERTPVVDRPTAVPIAAARSGVKALVTATAGSRFSQTVHTEVTPAVHFLFTTMLISVDCEVVPLISSGLLAAGEHIKPPG